MLRVHHLHCNRNVSYIFPFGVCMIVFSCQKDTGLKGLSFGQIIDLLKNERRYISPCDTFSSEGMKRHRWILSAQINSHVITGRLHTLPPLPQPVSLPLSAGQLLPAPLGWAPPTTGHFWGPARACWLQNSMSAFRSCVAGEDDQGWEHTEIPMSFAASSGSQTLNGEENPLCGEKNAGKFFVVP